EAASRATAVATEKNPRTHGVFYLRLVGGGHLDREMELCSWHPTWSRRFHDFSPLFGSRRPQRIRARRLLKVDVTIVYRAVPRDDDADLHRRAPAIIGRRATPQRALALVQRVWGRELRGVQGSPPEAQVPPH